MIDVTRLRKVNELARTLRSQGFVANQQEASSLATEIAGDREYKDVFGGMQVNEKQEMVVNMEEPAVAGDSMPQPALDESKYYTKEQVETVLQQFADQVCGQVTLLQEQVKSQQQLISSMQSSMEGLKKGAIIEQKVEQPQTVLNVENTAQEVTASRPEPVANNPRSGGFTSEDVSVDKIFYFGNR